MHNKIIGFTASVFLHGTLFAAGAMVLVKTPQFAVKTGASGMEVNLAAAPTQPVPVLQPAPKPVTPQPKKIVQPKPQVKPQPKPPVPSKAQGKDKITAHSKGGAITQAKPDYLSNPAPPYPFRARRNGWEGTVLLKVQVDKNGRARAVSIQHGCGHSLLDNTALDTVKTWRFRPAEINGVPLESTVLVPVKFSLEN